ncbi:hypothetical protein VTK26DRAFT_4203 [Humicola hyalothermophila]
MANQPPTLSMQRSALVWLSLAALSTAYPFPIPKNDLIAAGYGYLLPREQCAQYCGYNGQYCCEAGSVCYTSDGIAGCSATAGGGYVWYTTTWTETRTYTRTYNSFIPAATGEPGVDCVPPPGSGQIACGKICCANWQYCAYPGQCMANIGGGADGGGEVIPTTIVTDGVTITTQYSAPYRVTSGTATATLTDPGATDTAGAVSPGGTDEGGGLSGGAIAGIVVGTVAGVGLLLLICACCVVRGLWHGLLAVLGFGGKKDDDSSRYTHSRRDHHGSWYGGRPSTVAPARKEKKRSSGAGLLGLGAALGTLALLLGLRREKNKKDEKRRPPRSRSDVSSSYLSESYTASDPSSRSRSVRHSRAPSRVTRTTHTHTRVSRAPSARSQRSPRSRSSRR